MIESDVREFSDNNDMVKSITKLNSGRNDESTISVVSYEDAPTSTEKKDL